MPRKSEGDKTTTVTLLPEPHPNERQAEVEAGEVGGFGSEHMTDSLATKGKEDEAHVVRRLAHLRRNHFLDRLICRP